jgi:hypothetical protein
MPKNPEAQPPAGSPANPIPLARDKKLLRRYYAGERLRSPLGGYLDVLGIREAEKGQGQVLLECNASSLRFALMVPKATGAEVAAVKEALEAREEPVCPRHGSYQRLKKSGRKWVCPLCGVSFGKSA